MDRGGFVSIDTFSAIYCGCNKKVEYWIANMLERDRAIAIIRISCVEIGERNRAYQQGLTSRIGVFLRLCYVSGKENWRTTRNIEEMSTDGSVRVWYAF